MLGLGSNLMYPESALFGDVVLDVSGAQVTTSIFPTPDDEGVTIVMTFFTDTDNVYTAMGLNSPIPDTTDIGNKLNGTFDFTVTRYTFNLLSGQYEATTDTATVTGKTGYAAALIADNAIIFIASTSTGVNDFNGDYFNEGDGRDLFDLSSLGGDITDSNALNNIYVVQATYNPPSGFAGTVTATATQPIFVNPGPS
jgi:hypothetical protein